MNINKNKVDLLYSKLKIINDKLREKSNNSYDDATLLDAIHFSITSNGLSFLKGIMKKTYKSVSVMLSVRNIIESLVILLMEQDNVITKDQERAFKEQYKLIEYASYKDMEAYKEYCDFDYINNNFLEAKKVYEEIGYTCNIEKQGNKRIPFLMKSNETFESLLDKYIPSLKDSYKMISSYIHPNGYNKWLYELYDNLVLNIYENIDILYKDEPIDNNKTFLYEQSKLFDKNNKLTTNNILIKLINNQINSLEIIEDVFNRTIPNGYISNFIRELRVLIKDVSYDWLSGYCENVKIKFKVIVEMVSAFNKVITEDNNIIDSFRLINYYDNLNVKKVLHTTITQEDYDKPFEYYNDKYPNNKISKKTFISKFENKLGFLIDENGKTINYNDLVNEYIKELVKDTKLVNSNMPQFFYYQKMYKESHNMSHGIGYLYFANYGAWADDINVIKFLDRSIMDLINKIIDIVNKDFPNEKRNNILSNALKQCNEAVTKKLFIINNVTRSDRKF